jgi:hypothetical protein
MMDHFHKLLHQSLAEVLIMKFWEMNELYGEIWCGVLFTDDMRFESIKCHQM